MNIKDWLDERGISRDEAAVIFGKTPGTIRNWRSSGVPDNLQSWVKVRCEEYDADQKEGKSSSILRIELDKEKFRKWSKAAAEADMFILDWIEKCAEEAASKPERIYRNSKNAETILLSEKKLDEDS